MACTGGSYVAGAPVAGEGWLQNEGGAPAAPDNPSTLELDASRIEAGNVCPSLPCEWDAFVYVEGAAFDVTYAYTVHVEYA